MNHFEGCASESQFKERYKQLAKKHHPDLGGSERVMQEINSQFDRVRKNNFKKESDKAEWDDRDFHTSSSGPFGFGGFNWEDIYNNTKAQYDRAYAKRKAQREAEYRAEENRKIREKARRAKEEAEAKRKVKDEEKFSDHFEDARRYTSFWQDGEETIFGGGRRHGRTAAFEANEAKKEKDRLNVMFDEYVWGEWGKYQKKIKGCTKSELIEELGKVFRNWKRAADKDQWEKKNT